MEALGVAANVIAVIDISVKILQVCSQYAKEVKDARDDIEQFREEVADLQSVTKEVHRLINSPGGTKLRTPQSFAETIESSESLLSELCDRLEPAPKALQVDQTTVLLDVDSKLDKVDSQSIMRVLPSAAGAAYNSYAEEHNSTCLKNTRLELLQEIHDWIDNHQAQTIFWLNGMAGTGKSTIARTMASKWDKRGYLGASFFFKRGEADRGNLSRFYTTVARQLVVSTPGLAPHVKAAIEKDDSITTKAAAEQFDKLILQPLLQVQVTDKTVIAVTIDALDECEGDQEIRQLIDLLTRTRDVLDPRIRVLITSRPELPIRLGFNAIPGHYQDFVLHDIPESIITRDILVFLEEKLGDIRRTYNASVDEGRKLADDWPGMASTELLAQRATPLFIFAATVCRFISQRNCANPQKQLQKVLSYETKSQESKMDATYLPPLEQQLEELSKREQEEVVNEFQQIVGTLVLLESPLSVSALARLIDTSEQTIYGRLDMLHSVLKFPTTSETPIRLLHLSFRDFLLDPEKQGVNKFWVDKKQAHGRIAMGCLRVMDACLKEDICGLIVPGIERSEISPERVMSCISVELQYACRYWTFHVQEAESFAQAEEEILSFLKRHLLHWLEVLSLLGRSRESFRAIRILQTLAKVITIS
ncbi:hypothetical protein NW762_010136 [Fusarium torreyae]|uniref:NACHT domain-containing protein n=1 Tax=Fusarium torreyae TaxID=1237075 RepID=A0A9W8VBB3_9HYPO|nr:hypothetical protein NW762_010136 [Fusarium torreyae]